MTIGWAHAAPTILAAFFASLVEFVEALTVILAVGSIRGWRGALAGTAVALALLLAIVALLGPALTRVPLDLIQIVVGVLLLLFGLRWLRKAILRGVGVIPLHDETAAFAKESARLRTLDGARGWDGVAFGTSFQITMLEGMEVVFIVIAIGAGGAGLLWPASLGALAALLLVVALGVAVHRPLSNIPENSLKFAVGVLLSGFGTFWLGEGLGLDWPGGDWAILALSLGFLATGLLTMTLCRAAEGGVVTRWVAAIGREIFGLFVDDGRFAIILLLWVAAVAVVLPHAPLPPVWHGVVLFAGFALVLIWSCLRAAARRPA